MPRFVPAVLLILGLAGPIPGQDWPQWRGPNRDGTTPGAKLPKQWPVKPPEARWKVAIGEGYSGPAVADGRVCIMSREKDGLEVCWCFDAASGKQLWRHSYLAPFKPPDTCAGPGPKSTPTIDRDRVFTVGLGGMFHCFDIRTGKVIWKRDLRDEFWGVVKDPDGDDTWFPPCGVAASPLIDRDQVIFPVGGKKGGTFAGFERDSGKIAWQALEERSSYASPLFAEMAGLRQLVGFTGLRMVGLDAANHQLLWEHPFPALFEQTIVSPVVWKDLVIVGGERKPTRALRVEKSDGKITVKEAWRSTDMQLYMNTPVVFRDHLLGLDARLKRLVCVELATGKTRWMQGGFPEYASLIVAGDRVLVLAVDGTLHVLEANPAKFVREAQWQLSEAGETWSHLALAGGRLYVKDKDHLLCFDLER
jgi:outer membrane protein assembly factor BamB